MFNFKKEADTEYIDLTDIDVFQQRTTKNSAD